ncbi:response regulator transcription factor [Flavobacterium urocaniciphilum]|uniref:Two component transcriptional regulator, LuxR family n=1 Tax=Flavobacterium urocaniciphilum TaxID=1299341 RepID=A0A1H9ALL0_9FLAO|nr:response regulator transcription factor [Flavobacterium urocaniciphilum]SEP77610.1 two component transcriptional regulator, LuxR family [Flavobacterium urocaniciphilum]
MITVCLADNSPVVHLGVQTYFNNNSTIKVKYGVTNFADLERKLAADLVDCVIIDVELEGLNSILKIKTLLQEYPDLKVIFFTNVSDTMYAPPAIKAGVKAYVSKNVILPELENTITRVSNGDLIFSSEVKKAIEILNKTKKSERLYKKLSTREIEVLRYFSEGRKNKEVAKILDLDEKTISTYKLRLLQKLSVTNLLDLINKAKQLEII